MGKKCFFKIAEVEIVDSVVIDFCKINEKIKFKMLFHDLPKYLSCHGSYLR